MAAYKKMVNTRLNDPEHSEIKNIVMFSTSKVLDYSCKKKYDCIGWQYTMYIPEP